ncbi:hypothetical protein Sste5346_002298 [Sporothrix stenoceras]|uniref:Uncharacterized protein n=1 Tax=Sporothrix stenoceras TaxID=5173 RepID=A0ABR3ZJI5_9PEZI
MDSHNPYHDDLEELMDEYPPGPPTSPVEPGLPLQRTSSLESALSMSSFEMVGAVSPSPTMSAASSRTMSPGPPPSLASTSAEGAAPAPDQGSAQGLGLLFPVPATDLLADDTEIIPHTPPPTPVPAHRELLPHVCATLPVPAFYSINNKSDQSDRQAGPSQNTTARGNATAPVSDGSMERYVLRKQRQSLPEPEPESTTLSEEGIRAFSGEFVRQNEQRLSKKRRRLDQEGSSSSTSAGPSGYTESAAPSSSRRSPTPNLLDPSHPEYNTVPIQPEPADPRITHVRFGVFQHRRDGRPHTDGDSEAEAEAGAEDKDVPREDSSDTASESEFPYSWASTLPSNNPWYVETLRLRLRLRSRSLPRAFTGAPREIPPLAKTNPWHRAVQAQAPNVAGTNDPNDDGDWDWMFGPLMESVASPRPEPPSLRAQIVSTQNEFLKAQALDWARTVPDTPQGELLFLFLLTVAGTLCLGMDRETLHSIFHHTRSAVTGIVGTVVGTVVDTVHQHISVDQIMAFYDEAIRATTAWVFEQHHELEVALDNASVHMGRLQGDLRSVIFSMWIVCEFVTGLRREAERRRNR